MPRSGPPPKDPRQRARRNADPSPVTYVENRRIDQPALVDLLGPTNPRTEKEWSVPTLRLWDMLGDFPTTANLQAAQWHLLARSMILDDCLQRGELKAAAELRMELAKFGVAPDDVARLRIFFADAEEKEDKGAERKARKAATTANTSRERYTGLRAVGN